MVALHAFALAGFGPFIKFDAKIFGGALVGHLFIVSEKIIEWDGLVKNERPLAGWRTAFVFQNSRSK
jgi:hypothetical protein